MKNNIIFILVFILAFVNAFRAFKLYNFFQILDNKPKVSIIKFLDSLSPLAYATFMLFVYPINKKKYPNHVKEVNLINFFVYIIYVTFFVFIIVYFL